MTATPATTEHFTDDDTAHVVDVVGIGFGPANLALAIAIEEHGDANPAERLSAVFLERQPSFEWHPGMLLDGATMQIAFPKDLVTLRNPRSAFTFFSYLHDRGRLVDFVNHQTFFPSRHEFNDYLQWAAGRVRADVRWNREVVAVSPVRIGGRDAFAVTTADGERLLARNVAVGAGLRERIPEWATASSRCFHNHRFLFHVESMPEPVHGRFAVLGAGQSAAEIVQYLHTRYPEAEVHSVFARYGYSPADDSPYANRIFDPEAVDDFYGAPDPERRRLLDLHKLTNYSCVDIDLINELYRAEYQERVRGQRRLFMHRASEIVGVRETDTAIDVEVRSTVDGLVDSLTCDALVLATGFTPAPLAPLFGDLVPADHSGVIGRDYRLDLRPATDAGVYLQGGTERTHGLTSSLLSNVAMRSGDILESLLADRARETNRDSGTTLDSVNSSDTYATSEAK
ncbi:L-lysine 6-monooxygenase [Rhodococcus rhodnii]|uniref:L-lysine N6-monooxygenase MbtG n=2 Tax=Rhodococcus rhodnii TaxID=38312 RepID=R7WHE9_9NOCA|nr:SidA/IucD/PvdA family monooxygenase [Rhodococcus rhodnii]EOM74467.1 L-ornithine 5-monooxygenase [Rhodococcus rhodnii LMG 5362]TXG89162.1 L-lysine 6-monooxygenase [Rhodococcus rhodnii]